MYRRFPLATLRPWRRRCRIPVRDVTEGDSAEQRVLQFPVRLAVTTPAHSRWAREEAQNPSSSARAMIASAVEIAWSTYASPKRCTCASSPKKRWAGRSCSQSPGSGCSSV